MQSKAQASLDAALTRKAVGLRRASDSEDDSRKNKMANAQQSLFDDELGLERYGSFQPLNVFRARNQTLRLCNITRKR